MSTEATELKDLTQGKLESAELETALAGASSPDEIKSLIEQELHKQGLNLPGREAKPEAEKGDAKDDAEQPLFKDTFVIGGKTVEITGSDAADVLRQYKASVQAYNIAQEELKAAQAKPKPEEPKLTAEDKASLQLQLQLGQLSVEQYLEKTNAIGDYLKKKGVDLDELRQTVKETQSQKVFNSWQDATSAFLADANNDWPGGRQNEKILKLTLAELGLHSSPSKDSLVKAYEHMKAEGLVYPVAEEAGDTAPTAQAEREARPQGRGAPAPVAQQERTQPRRRAAGSSVFGTSAESGTRRARGGTGDVAIPKDIENDPRAIMEYFKSKAAEAGMSPDDVFRQAYTR